MIEQFAPVRRNIPLEEIWPPSFLSPCGLSPDPRAIDFLADLSRALFGVPKIREYPETAALAHWLRRAHLQKLADDFEARIGEDEIAVPRGVVLHVAPANVETMFLYSWAASLLVGNANMVRVSRRSSEQSEILFAALRACMAEKKHGGISGRNVFLTYDPDDRIGEALAARADARVLWGGDESVLRMRAYPCKPACKDIAFADKTSCAVIEASRYLALGDEEASKLAKKFHNDAYWFDQMACSSPRVVYFLGDEGSCLLASRRFWARLRDELERRGRSEPMAVAANKIAYLYECAAWGHRLELPDSGVFEAPHAVHLRQFEIPAEHCGGGFFWQIFAKGLADLADAVTGRDQTWSHFGLEREALKTFVRSLGGKGIDRVVPIGRALEFSLTWDGYLLLSELTRRVAIESF